jgi:2-methylaconitate cis-trans-isomerase PrpF
MPSRKGFYRMQTTHRMGQLLSTFTIGTLERSKFQSRKGQADEVGEYSIDGVSGTGAKIQLDFFRPGGAKTRHLLPTGIAVDNVAGVQASCIDAASPCTFVRFEDTGIDGTILPNDFNKLS